MVLAHDINTSKRTQDIRTNQDVFFDSLLLSEKTLGGLNDAGFYKPSPVQLHGIPMGKCGFDLLLEAKSGTGKTVVFTVIALEKINLQKGLQTIILAPTREIASQICDVIKAVGVKYKGLCVAVVMGGMPLQDDINKFKTNRNVHIVVGSPGRLRHLIQDNYLDTSAVRLLVLDEADKLIEKSFRADINFIFSSLPAQKQVLMSSATYSESAKEFIAQYVIKPQHICPDTTSILLGIEQKVSLVNSNTNIVKQTQLRYDELIKILTTKEFKQCLIFCNYQARVADLFKLLTRDKWPSEQLYGLQQQTDRLDALKTLQEFKCRILISTDLAARGIDASNVDLVINFEPPYEWQTYLHRIGRAGRYGSYGTAVSIVAQGKEEVKFKEILGIVNGTLNITNTWNNTKYDLKPLPKNMGESASKLISSEINANENSERNNINETKNQEVISKKIQSEKKSSLSASEYHNIFQDLWGPNRNHRDTGEVESFNDLMKSFESTNTLDTFDDILQSFENHSNGIIVKQKNKKIDVDDVQIAKCITHLKKEGAVGMKFSEAADISKINYSKEIKTEDLQMLVGPKLSNGTVNEQKPSRNDINNGLVNNEFENDELSQELSEMAKLGLPTSFYSKADSYIEKRREFQCKAKYKNRIHDGDKENKNSSKTDQKCNEVPIEIKQKSTILQIGSPPQKQSNFNLEPANETKLSKVYNEYVSNYDKNPGDNLPKSNKSLKAQIKPRTKEKPQNEAVRGKKTHNAKSHISNDHYEVWYNALKQRTSQLEYIFYIQEMTQIENT